MLDRLLKTLGRLHNDQRGVFSIAHIAATLFLLIMLIGTFNVGAALVDRSKMQRRADAIAQSLGTWKARHLNAVVAHQHLMGELLSLVVIHHAIGGELLDQQKAADTKTEDRMLEAAYRSASTLGAQTPAYSDVSEEVLAEEALLKSHVKLKELLTMVYLTKTAARVMQLYPPTAPAGRALEQAADAFEQVIHAEWQVLETIRKLALSLTSLKQNIRDQVLPQAKQQLERMIAAYPKSQNELAKELARRFELEVHVLPSDRRLPVIVDPWADLMQPPTSWQRPVGCNCPSAPADNMRHQIAKITQLARATFPWVNYHRWPLINAMKPITPLSGMGDHYFDSTAGVSKNMMDHLQRDPSNSLALYVLDDYEGPDKAFEDWMKPDGSGAADKTFGVTVVVGTTSREPVGSFFFRKQPGDAMYRFATALAWNRLGPRQPNHRIDLYCKRIVPSVQAKTGWDTLNWSHAVDLHELVGFGIKSEFPTILPSWTSRLSPTSAARISEIQNQPLPNWARSIKDVLPDTVEPELVGI